MDFKQLEEMTHEQFYESMVHANNRVKEDDFFHFIWGKTFSEFWRQCKRADWMLWMLLYIIKPYDLRMIVAVKTELAELLKNNMSKKDKIAIDFAKRFADGEGEFGDLVSIFNTHQSGIRFGDDILKGAAEAAANGACSPYRAYSMNVPTHLKQSCGVVRRAVSDFRKNNKFIAVTFPDPDFGKY